MTVDGKWVETFIIKVWCYHAMICITLFWMHVLFNICFFLNINVREYQRGNRYVQSRETGNVWYTRRRKTPRTTRTQTFLCYFYTHLVIRYTLHCLSVHHYDTQIFAFLVPCCDVRYNFRITTMFGSSLPPICCRRAHVVFTLFVCLRAQVVYEIFYTWDS
jgi:hypothetical protein